MTTAMAIESALNALNPTHLKIQDDSHLHAGHAGNQGGGHYTVLIVSEAFEGLSLVKRHRLVFSLVDSLMQQAIHALSIQAKTPAEWGRDTQ
jgi:BolA protein